MRIILLGPPGAGKGTQAASVSKQLQHAHISSGDLFREEQQKGTDLGLLAKKYMERGELVPNEVTIKMIVNRIAQPDCAKGCILDGFPRNLDQAKALDEALKNARSKGIDKVVYINVSGGELLRRLGGRWVCRAAQHPYHMVSSTPKKKGVCDLDGSALYQRADASEDTARRPLQVYFDQTAPLVDYYKKQRKLAEVNGEQDIDKVGKDLVAALQ